MAEGLDYVHGPSTADLKAAGISFVCRYLSEVNPATQVKLLTAAEAQALSEAGISIIRNFEWCQVTHGLAMSLSQVRRPRR